MKVPICFLLGFLLVSSAASAEVAKSAEEVAPLAVGMPVPDAELRTASGDVVSLRALTAGKPTVLVFYRGGWCPYCNTQLSGLVEAEARLNELGYQIIALSPDRPEEVAETQGESMYSYRLLSDASAEAAKAFGVAFVVDESTFGRLKSYGIDLEAASGEKHRILPVPAVFIIDAAGEIGYRYFNPDYRERLSEEKLVEAAEKLLDRQKLAVLWTSGDPEVAHRVALMYTDAARRYGWFDAVQLIIWGPSQRLLVADKDVQAYVARLQEAGVEVRACIVCARSYGVVDALESLNIEVAGMGMPLTEHLKAEDWTVLTF